MTGSRAAEDVQVTEVSEREAADLFDGICQRELRRRDHLMPGRTPQEAAPAIPHPAPNRGRYDGAC